MKSILLANHFSETVSDDLPHGGLELVQNPRHVHVQYFFGCWTASNLLLRTDIFNYLLTFESTPAEIEAS